MDWMDRLVDKYRDPVIEATNSAISSSLNSLAGNLTKKLTTANPTTQQASQGVKATSDQAGIQARPDSADSSLFKNGLAGFVGEGNSGMIALALVGIAIVLGLVARK